LYNWRTSIYEIYQHSDIYIQPPVIPHSQSIDVKSNTVVQSSDKQLSESDETELHTLLRTVTIEQQSTTTVVEFAVSHCTAALYVIDILVDSLTLSTTPANSKLARLYILSDILYNSSNCDIRNISLYRTGIQPHIHNICQSFHCALLCQPGRISKNTLSDKVMKVLNTWTEWSIYSTDIIQQCIQIFIHGNNTHINNSNTMDNTNIQSSQHTDIDDDIDGVPIT
jgi:U2-associated protein SR140